MSTTRSGITRRELLKRGALVGGAALWATPVVQSVGMGRAYAKPVSPGCIRYCLKWEVDGNGETGDLTCVDNGANALPIWSNNWVAMGEGTGQGTVLTCPDDGRNSDSTAQSITSRENYEFVVYRSVDGKGFHVAFPSDVTVADLSLERLDSIAVKCGQANDSFASLKVHVDPCLKDPTGAKYNVIEIPDCGSGNDISHFELIVDWCP